MELDFLGFKNTSAVKQRFISLYHTERLIGLDSLVRLYISPACSECWRAVSSGPSVHTPLCRRGNVLVGITHIKVVTTPVHSALLSL